MIVYTRTEQLARTPRALDEELPGGCIREDNLIPALVCTGNDLVLVPGELRWGPRRVGPRETACS